VLNTMNQIEPHDYDGNMFIGVVVFNDDPLKLRRVKVTIPGLFETDDPAKLPWIGPAFTGPVANLPLASEPGKSGSYALVPGIGAELVVILQDGSPLHGLYTGSPIRPNSTTNEFVTNYIRRYGWQDPIGNIFRVDTTPGANVIRMYHASGAELTIVNNGDTRYYTPGRYDVIAEMDITFTSKQKSITSEAFLDVETTAHRRIDYLSYKGSSYKSKEEIYMESYRRFDIKAGYDLLDFYGTVKYGMSISSAENLLVKTDGRYDLHSKGDVGMSSDLGALGIFAKTNLGIFANQDIAIHAAGFLHLSSVTDALFSSTGPTIIGGSTINVTATGALTLTGSIINMS
jgi:hypothetical protein